MAHPEPRSEAQLAVARVHGQRWRVAAREGEWAAFLAVGHNARTRLTVVMMHFCAEGEADLPRGAFRWLSKSGQVDGATREGAFEAHGVVLRGRASDDVFFITAVEVDVAEPMLSRRARLVGKDPRQQILPYIFTSPGGTDNG